MTYRRPYTPNCYYAHPITDYGTEREAAGVNAIEAAGFTVLNPNTPEHAASYEQGGMEHFLNLVAACQALAFQRFPGGQLGAGVGKEIGAAAGRHLPVYEVQGDQLNIVWPEVLPSVLDTVLSVDDTRELLEQLRAQA